MQAHAGKHTGTHTRVFIRGTAGCITQRVMANSRQANLILAYYGFVSVRRITSEVLCSRETASVLPPGDQ